MKRTYADLHLSPNLRDVKQTSNLLNKAAALGYKLIAISFPPYYSEQEIHGIQNVCTAAKVDLATRVDLRPRAPSELTRILRKLRRKFEIIAVICESKNVARQAAKDRRVDLLNFPAADFRRRFFDRAEAELASNSLASFEIDTKPLLTLQGPARIRLLSSLRKETSIAKDFHVPIVISSGVSTELLLRKPIEQASLTFLFDLDKEIALDAISKAPHTLVKRNREKLDPRFVAPGIQIVRKGKDC